MGGVRDGTNATSELILAVGTLAAAGFTEALLKYKEHEANEHLSRIMEVDKLFKRHLLKIPVKDNNNRPTGEQVSFSAPFELDSPDHPTKAKSLQLTSSILEDLDKLVPMYRDPQMAPCARRLLNALAYFREFHDDRIHERDYSKGKEDDVTSSVICYLMLEISVHCIKFEGTQQSIAYLNGLTNFVRGYASLHKDSQRYERLTLAFGELENAKLLLKDHALTRSHEDLICDFLPMCTHLSEMMIKTLTKLGTPQKIWKKVNSTTLERLAEGIIKPKFERDHNLHVPLFRMAHATVLKESPVQKWIDDLATNFLLSEAIASGTQNAELRITGEEYIDQHKRYSDKAIALLQTFQDEKLSSENLAELEDLHYFTGQELSELQKKVFTAGQYKEFIAKGYFSHKTIEHLNERGLIENEFKDSPLARPEIEDLRHVKLFSKMLMGELKKYKDEILSAAEIKKLQDKRFTEKELKELHEMFKECDNFLTLVPEQKNFRATHTFAPIQDDAHIIERARLYSSYATLIRKMLIVQYFSFHLWNRIKELGEIYVANPSHCNFNL